MEALIVVGLITLGALTIVRRRKNFGFSAPLANPIVTSGWGAPRTYRATQSDPRPLHYGLDFRASNGTPIRPVMSGIVTAINNSYDTHAGRWVRVSHSNGFVSEYLHLETINCSAGQPVYSSTVIALSGDTGITGPGSHVPHLHLTMRASRSALDEYLVRFGRPHSDFFNSNKGGTAVPGEPLIPASYSSGVIASAFAAGVSRPLNTAKGIT